MNTAALPLATACFACIVGSASLPADAAPASKTQVTEHQSDLQALRKKMQQLQRDVAGSESSRAEVADQLRETERAISELQRELLALGNQRRERLAAYDTLQQQAGGLANDLDIQRQHLEQTLVRRYIQGAPDPARLLLSGRNPDQISRDLVYVAAIADARQTLVQQTRATLDDKRQLAEATQRETEALAAIEKRQREKQGMLESRRADRQQLLANLSQRIASQQKEIGALRRDEQRLTRVIDRLTRLLAEAERTRQKRLAARAKTGAKTPARAPTSATADSLQGPARGVGLPDGLAQPVRGTLVQRFGSPQDGGGRWKGLFFRTTPGAEVRAAAGGQVVFADWLRGFGNLLIVDHGSGLLTIYGYNDALLREVGDQVQRGSVIATAGNSGGRGETGLYFELRHQGTAVDPGRWLRQQ